MGNDIKIDKTVSMYMVTIHKRLYSKDGYIWDIAEEKNLEIRAKDELAAKERAFCCFPEWRIVACRKVS